APVDADIARDEDEALARHVDARREGAGAASQLVSFHEHPPRDSECRFTCSRAWRSNDTRLGSPVQAEALDSLGDAPWGSPGSAAHMDWAISTSWSSAFPQPS